MEDLYSFMERYIRESFDEYVLKTSPRGVVSKLRHKESHQLYICLRFTGSADLYRSLAGKTCRNLPQILEVAQESAPATDKAASPGRSIILEEFVAGDTLEELLKAGPLSNEEVRRISMQLCKGLYVLHSLGWVHRDIKPENVIINGDRTVLIDFDAARYYDAAKTKDTRVLGTVGYAPPEQYGISETDFRADIYAMGVLINEMLTGAHPSQTLARGHFGRIVSRCTMIHPKKRYTSVRELMEVL